MREVHHLVDGKLIDGTSGRGKSSEPPQQGMQVDLDIAGNQATSVYVDVTARQHHTANSGAAGSSYAKSKLAAGLLAISLGGLSIHKFYLGYSSPGVILLLCGTIGWLLVIPVIVASIIGLIEGIIYLTKSDDQFNMEYHCCPINFRRTEFGFAP